ncbi:MAG: hypothetical protein JW787_18590 [Sedimentisphaerales bacterium]|nr:hypothetical protein [Sedimentisphaerales bacterium]
MEKQTAILHRNRKLWIIVLSIFITGSVFPNGGPFVVKYPSGDPAAKGVLARLGQDLKPGIETNLKVVKEELKIAFTKDQFPVVQPESSPLVNVSAEYTIENPREEDIEVDFGFPILRGIYTDPLSMMPKPEVDVKLGGKIIQSTIISNSAIYGIIRQRTRMTIQEEILKNEELGKLVESVRNAKESKKDASRKKLKSYLIDTMKWSSQDAALMIEYASFDFGNQKSQPPDRLFMLWGTGDKELNELINANLGPLSAIGEQKATQFLARLAALLNPAQAVAYEDIFNAWGGDVREQSVDLNTGEVRRREMTVAADISVKSPEFSVASDPTIYARVDYLDPRAKITDTEKESCKNILKNLPVIFTFAPMNILYYKVVFPAGSTQTLTVSYKQYAYSDTRSPESYQVAYVVHPASFWNEFGPINLEVTVPEGIRFRASDNAGIQEGVVKKEYKSSGPDIFTGMLKSKKGEIYLAIDTKQWKEFISQKMQSTLDKNFQTNAK